MEITLIYLKYFCVNFVPWWIFSNCHIKKRSIIAREQVAAKRLKSFWQRKKDEPVDVATKIDGTCQKRHGHNPKLDVTFTISVDNGEVLHYEIKVSYCKKFQCNTRDHNCNKKHLSSSDSFRRISTDQLKTIIFNILCTWVRVIEILWLTLKKNWEKALVMAPCSGKTIA